jgi:hypothetical protein
MHGVPYTKTGISAGLLIFCLLTCEHTSVESTPEVWFDIALLNMSVDVYRIMVHKGAEERNFPTTKHRSTFKTYKQVK